LRLRVLCLLASATCFAQDGAAIYRARCSTCHDSPKGRTPALATIHVMSDTAILRAIESGSMRLQATGLSAPERAALAHYLAGGAAKPEPAPPMATTSCSQQSLPADLSTGPVWNGFGAGLSNARFQTAKAAGLTAADVPKLRLRWAFGLGDVSVARGQPVVLGGNLLATSTAGKLYSLDAKTGCVHWVFGADAPIRSGVVAGAVSPSQSRLAVFFGDARANVYAVDFETGKLLWQSQPESHPAAMITDTPNYYQGVVYVGLSSAEEVSGAAPFYQCCTFRGSVVALDSATGKPIWKTYTVQQEPKPTTKTKTGVQRRGPSGAAVWSTPTVDAQRDAIYIATGDNYSEPTTDTSDAVLALDRRTGKILWSHQMTANDAFIVSCLDPEKTNCPDSDGPDLDFGQPPILVSLPNGKRALVIGQKSGVAHAIDPDRQGEVLWQMRVGKGGVLGGIQWGSAADEKIMYVALSDIAFKPAPDPAHPGKTISVLDPDAGGGLFALQLLTGEKVWRAAPRTCGQRPNCSPAQSAAVTAIPGVVFSGSVDGHLRAYSSTTGEVIWDYDTVRDFDAVNGQKARGGSIDGSGPAVAGGMVYVYSGYAQSGGMPGNALLAFSVEGR